MADKEVTNELPVYLFHQGTNYRAYEFLGCHFNLKTGVAVFRTWAPKAKSVHLVGDFNHWGETEIKMTRISDGGVWESTVEGVEQYQRYKYAITSGKDGRVLKSDPYAFCSETEDRTASIVFDLNGYEWGDIKWRETINKRENLDYPMNIYELHLGSWMRDSDGQAFSYTELAKRLIPYIKEMNYTHIELMRLWSTLSEAPGDIKSADSMHRQHVTATRTIL